MQLVSESALEPVPQAGMESLCFLPGHHSLQPESESALEPMPQAGMESAT